MASRVAERFSFGKIPEVLPLPNLLAVQHESFQWFLDEGLREIFEEISPIEDFTGSLALELTEHRFGEPQMTLEEAQQALGQPAAQMAEWTGGYTVSSLALPTGDFPRDPALLRAGTYADTAYSYSAAVGTNQGLANSPLAENFDPYHIPRVKASGEDLSAWLKQMEVRGDFYVSGGE